MSIHVHVKEDEPWAILNQLCCCCDPIKKSDCLHACTAAVTEAFMGAVQCISWQYIHVHVQ